MRYKFNLEFENVEKKRLTKYFFKNKFNYIIKLNYYKNIKDKIKSF